MGPKSTIQTPARLVPAGTARAGGVPGLSPCLVGGGVPVPLALSLSACLGQISAFEKDTIHTVSDSHPAHFSDYICNDHVSK